MVSPELRAADLARVLALAALLTGAAVISPAEAQTAARTPCGAFEAVPSGVGPSGVPTRLTIQKNGRLLDAVSAGSITRVECALFGDGRAPALLVTSFSGGPRCCETLRVWALEPSPRLALIYEGRSATGFELRDLNDDGRFELVLGDDSFADFDDLSESSAPGRLPLVACAAGTGFEDCTARFPGLLRSATAPYADRLSTPAPGTGIGDLEGAALGVLALSVLAGQEDAGLALIRKAVSNPDVLTWIDRARPKVRAWSEARGRRLKTSQ